MYTLEKPLDDNQQIAIYENDIVKDIEWNDVLIPRCVWCYSIKDLEYQKSELNKQIEEIDKKINVIWTELIVTKENDVVFTEN